MQYKQAFQSEHKGGCGSMGRGRFGGAWSRGKFDGFRARSGFGRYMGGTDQPPVNIEETDDSYVILLFAAGLSKERVTLTVKDDVLRIAYPGSDAATNQETAGGSANTGGYTYQEYSQRAFERAFRLNDKVLTDQISATYTDGILRVTLPKNPATNVPAQTITVA